MAATHAVSGLGSASGPGLAGDLIARLSEKVHRLLNPNGRLFHSSETAEELIVARQGPVEIRRTLACWSLETSVKGVADRARATALCRLANYVNGKNPGRTLLHVVRPLVQTEESKGRWRFRVPLPGINGDFVAASGRSGRVRLRVMESETLAVIRVPGRPTSLAIQHAETAIRHAVAATRWEASGGAMLRLHALSAVLPFRSRFEVAVPVTERMQGSTMPDWMRHAVFSRQAVQEHRTPPGPLIR
jgi:hypothetical protein